MLSWLLERLWLEDCQSDQPGNASLLSLNNEKDGIAPGICWERGQRCCSTF